MKFLLLHYADESAEWSAEETQEDQALLAAWLEDTIARGVNLQGSYLQPSRNAATIRARDGELLLTDERAIAMYPNNAYDLYQAERTRTHAEVLAADTLRGRWAVAHSRRGRRSAERRGRGRGIMVIIAGRTARAA